MKIDQIGIRLTRNEALNIAILSLFALNGTMPFSSTLHIFGAGNSGGHNIYDHLAFVFFVTGTIYAFWSNRCRIHWELWTCRFAALYLAWTLLSLLWGTAPLHSVYAPTVMAICTFLYINYVLDRFSVTEFTRMLVWLYAILLAISLVAVIILPGLALDPGIDAVVNKGAWQGIFDQKNQLGLASAIAIAVALGLRPESTLDRGWRRLLLTLGLICALGSKSREAWIVIAICFSLVPFLALLRELEPRSRITVVIGSVLFLSLILPLIYFNLDSILALLGRDRTLTGRTDIWSDTLLLIRRRPWLGYGTYGVWNTPWAFDVVVREGWIVSSSHSSYLETLLSYGIIGFLCFIPIPLTSFLYIFRALMNYDLRRIQVLIFLVMLFLVMSISMALILYTPGIGLLVLVYSVANLEKIERTGLIAPYFVRSQPLQ